jgi:glyceraldehyde-3-phosphate dehydrogenase/erythrose-4-phosphate dehydrogenase
MIKVAILGYGNIGKYAEEAVMSAPDMALAGIAAMEDFYHSIDMPINMSELGIHPTEEQILEMAASCARAVGGCIGSAKVLYEADMYEIFKMAL